MSEQQTVNPWSVDISTMDKRSKEYKDLIRARAEVPNPVTQDLTHQSKFPEASNDFNNQQPPVQQPINQTGLQSVTNDKAGKYDKPEVKTSDSFYFPDKVILKPIQNQKFRLGLENTKEGFLRMPGVKYNWEPSIVGSVHKDGLWRLNSAEILQLEAGVGRKLDSDYYNDMTYRMDASNPNGHHMDLSRPTEKLVYLAMLESHLIAEGLINKQNGNKPEAEWYIENLEAEAELKEKEQDKFRKVFTAYDGLSDRKKIAFAKILNVAVRGLTPKVASTKLWDKLLEKAVGYEKLWERFVKMTEWSDEKINVYEEVKDAVAVNIIRKNNAQDYIYGDEVLGSTEDQVISKMLMSENAGLRIAIKQKLSIR